MKHTVDEVLEEGLGGEVRVCWESICCVHWTTENGQPRTVLLEVLLAGGDELQGDELEAVLLG